MSLPCECVVPLLETDDSRYCPSCGRGYPKGSGVAFLKAVQLHGPIMTAEEHKGFMEHLREMRSDDDDPQRNYDSQKPETD